MKKKHFELLAGGFVTWNSWRSQFPDTVPNLVRADLEGSPRDKKGELGESIKKCVFKKANPPESAAVDA